MIIVNKTSLSFYLNQCTSTAVGAAGDLANIEGWAKKERVWAKKERVWAWNEKCVKNAFCRAKI